MAKRTQIKRFHASTLFYAVFLILNFSFFISLTGCVKDDIYNTDHPNKARVTITTDWSDRGTEVDKPASYTMVTGNIKEEVNTDKYTLNTLLEPGNHTFYLYNHVTQIPVTGGMAKVNTVTPSQAEEGTYIEPLPGWLFTGIQIQQLEKDSECQFTTTMHQQVRQLTLIVEPEGSTANRVTAIKGYLTGVAGELDILNGTHTTASKVELDFTKLTDGTNAGKWIAIVRLLGITGEEQKLIGTVSFTDNLPKDMVLESDLSQDLPAFNNDKKTPLTLGGEIVEVPTEAGFTATIRQWEKVNEGSGTAI